MEFGIALPMWIVDGKNSYIVLGIYFLIFMVIMPTIVVSNLTWCFSWVFAFIYIRKKEVTYIQDIQIQLDP